MGAAMCGSDAVSGSLFSYVDLEDRIPAKHPLRLVREIVNEVLEALDAGFAKMYAALGRPSIPPEKLLRGSLLQAFYTIRVMLKACLRHDTPADGAARLQPAVPLVCRHGHR